MKKKIIWIPLVIIAAGCFAFYIYLQIQPKGDIKIEAAGAELKLQGGSFGRTKTVSSTGPAALSTGTYRPQLLQITTRRGGDTYQIESRGPWGKLEQIEVKEKQTTTIQLGPPLVIKPVVNKGGQQQVSIGLSITGQAGEEYRNVVTKNNQRVPAPNVKIVDEAGAVLAVGNFAYG